MATGLLTTRHVRFDEWWFPAGETHLQKWMASMQQRRHGRLGYQLHKYDAALRHCAQRRLAIDVGAHVGLWSYFMAQDFAKLWAFEPHPDHRACWVQNVRASNAVLIPTALGDHTGRVALHTPSTSSGDTHIDPSVRSGGDVTVMRLDDFPTVQDLDFLKIDCEGYELFVVLGALRTILRDRPVIIVEQKPQHGRRYGIADTSARDLLVQHGYRQRQNLNDDIVLTCH